MTQVKTIRETLEKFEADSKNAYIDDSLTDKQYIEKREGLVEAALQDISRIVEEIIDAEVEDWANGAAEKERFIRHTQINQTKKAQKLALKKALGE